MKFNWSEVYKILNSLNAGVLVVTGAGVYRDTVNHYYCIAHKQSDPSAFVHTSLSDAAGICQYRIAHQFINDAGNWCYRLD